MNVYPITFHHADGTTVDSTLVSAVSITAQFWTLTPAGNGTQYSAYPSGVGVPAPTWTSVPNFLNETTSVSVNILTTYITPTTGCTCVINGSLPTGWAFNGTSLTYNGTSVNSVPTSVSFMATLTATGNTANSNTFTVQGKGSPVTDTLAPTVPVGTAISANTVAGGVVLGGITPSDSNPPGTTWSGFGQVNVLRNGSALGNTGALGQGNKPTLILADLGGPFTPASTITQTGADVAFTTVASGVFPTSDGWATAFQQLTGTSWTISCKISSFTAADQYSNVRLAARPSLSSTDAYVAVDCFPFSQGAGFKSENRSASGASSTAVATAANTTAPAWLILNRSGDTYSFFYSLDGNTLNALGTVTQVMGSTLYVGVAAATDNGASISVTAQQVSIQTLANWTYTDSTVTPGTAYTYSATSQDLVPNVSAASAAISVTAASSSTTFKYLTGIYLWPNGFWTTAQQVSDLGSCPFNGTLGGYLATISNNTHIAGLNIKVDWSNLETGIQGVYTNGFQIIDDYLAALALCATPKSLMLELFSYRYGNCNGTNPSRGNVFLPAYMTNINTGSNSQIDYCIGGQRTYAACIWNSIVYNSMINLSAAYATRYNTNPRFAMFQPMEETAQYSGNASAGFTGEAQSLASCAAIYAALKTQWTQTPVRFPVNYTPAFTDASLSNWLNTIIGAYGKGLVSGGPDTLPESGGGNIIPANYVFRGLNSGVGSGAGTKGTANSGFTNYQTHNPGVPWLAEIESTEMCQAGSLYCASPVSATLPNEGAYGSATMKAAFWSVYLGSWLPAGCQPADVLSNAAAGTFPVVSTYPVGW